LAGSLTLAMGTLGWERADAGEPLPWRVGTGRRDITPPLEVGILMSSSRRRWAPFECVRSPLHARAIVIEQGAARVGIVSLDLLGLAGEAVGGFESFKRRIADRTPHGLTPDQIVLCSTHTHSGPESISLSDLQQTDPFQRWIDVLATRIAESLSDAAGSLHPCRLRAGAIASKGLSRNRRLLTTRGVTSPRAVRPTDTVLGPEGPVDDQVRILAFEGEPAGPLALLVQATSHPVYEMCLKQVAPDYPGEMTRSLEERHAGIRALFFQGAAGNINPPHVSTGAADAQQHGRELADLVDRALPDLAPVTGQELALRWRTIALPARNLDGQPRSEPLAARIAALRLGQAAMVFLPGEPFVEIALRIIKESPWSWTAVAGYSDEYVGYIPTDRAFANRGYETGPGRWSHLAPGSESVVCDEAIKLLRQL
jgi:hypothetical protein